MYPENEHDVSLAQCPRAHSSFVSNQFFSALSFADRPILIALIGLSPSITKSLHRVIFNWTPHSCCAAESLQAAGFSRIRRWFIQSLASLTNTIHSIFEDTTTSCFNVNLIQKFFCCSVAFLGKVYPFRISSSKRLYPWLLWNTMWNISILSGGRLREVPGNSF